MQYQISGSSLGIDIGSTTAKIVLVRRGKVVYEKYERHLSQVREKTLELIRQIRPMLEEEPFTVALSGSAGLGVAEAAQIPFVQEVYATGEVVRQLEPDTSAVIELGGEDAKVIFFDGGWAFPSGKTPIRSTPSYALPHAGPPPGRIWTGWKRCYRF